MCIRDRVVTYFAEKAFGCCHEYDVALNGLERPVTAWVQVLGRATIYSPRTAALNCSPHPIPLPYNPNPNPILLHLLSKWEQGAGSGSGETRVEVLTN